MVSVQQQIQIEADTEVAGMKATVGLPTLILTLMLS